jgi:hypothetical protein
MSRNPVKGAISGAKLVKMSAEAHGRTATNAQVAKGAVKGAMHPQKANRAMDMAKDLDDFGANATKVLQAHVPVQPVKAPKPPLPTGAKPPVLPKPGPKSAHTPITSQQTGKPPIPTGAKPPVLPKPGPKR